MDLDPERELWVPGRKKIFIPSAPKPMIGFDWGQRQITVEMLDFSSLYLFHADCVPSRGQIITYGDIKRSEVPMFRSRPRYGVLYDRYERGGER
jgi:hypothetical protein